MSRYSTSDFNSVMITGESRQDADAEASLFCGGAAVNATNLMNYALYLNMTLKKYGLVSYTTEIQHNEKK